MLDALSPAFGLQIFLHRFGLPVADYIIANGRTREARGEHKPRVGLAKPRTDERAKRVVSIQPRVKRALLAEP